MPRFRKSRTTAAGVLAVAAWGGLSPARAQASGTLQASVTVIDDPVSRSVSAGIPLLVRRPPPGREQMPLPIPLNAPADVVRATIRELPSDGAARRIRVDIVFLN